MTQYIRYPSVAGGGATTDVNLVEVGGAAITLGQKTMANSLPVVIASNQSTLNVNVASSVIPSGAATEVTLAAFSAKTAAAFVAVPFDEVDITYVPSGAGAGQIATVVYSLLGSTVRTLTMSYDGSDRLSNVVAS